MVGVCPEFAAFRLQAEVEHLGVAEGVGALVGDDEVEIREDRQDTGKRNLFTHKDLKAASSGRIVGRVELELESAGFERRKPGCVARPGFGRVLGFVGGRHERKTSGPRLCGDEEAFIPVQDCAGHRAREIFLIDVALASAHDVAHIGQWPGTDVKLRVDVRACKGLLDELGYSGMGLCGEALARGDHQARHSTREDAAVHDRRCLRPRDARDIREQILGAQKHENVAGITFENLEKILARMRVAWKARSFQHRIGARSRQRRRQNGRSVGIGGHKAEDDR